MKLDTPGPPASREIPFCVDLDGTLVRTDLLLESALRAVRLRPWDALLIPLWAMRGRRHLKQRLAERGAPDVTTLPYDQRVLQLAVRAREQGRQVVLVTGSERAIAERVAEHVGVFHEVLASDSEVNLTGKRKARELVDRYGQGGFEYAGDGRVDLPVWDVAGAAVTVGAPRPIVTRVAALGRPHRDLPVTPPGLRTWMKALRVHQWSKNVLLFIPLILSHRFLEPALLGAAALGLACFCLCASGTYLVNDLLDLEADRRHAAKRVRPLAAGAIGIIPAGLIAPLLVLAGMAASLLMPRAFQVALLIYVVATALYSLYLKRVASVDVVTLAGLYTLRIVAGALAVGVPLSFWLAAFSVFIFLSLALVKRAAELLEVQERAGSGEERVHGREYSTADLPVIQALGAAAGYLSVLVLALYINSQPESLLYRTPQFLWFVAPIVLLWVTRLWIVTSRGQMHDDPVVFAIKDTRTWITVALAGLFVALAALVDLGR